MKTPKNTLFLLATLFATPAFATWVTLEGGSTAESAVSFADNYSNTTELVLVAPTDATSTYFNANGKTIQYLKADGSANVYVSGGFTIDAPASGNSLLFDGSTNVDSQLTFSNGTYNFGTADAGLSDFGFKINSYVGSSSNPAPKKAVVFDSDSIVNIYAQQATFSGPYYGVRKSLPAYIVQGTFNVYNPTGEGYGNIYLRWDTSVIDGTTRGARPGMQIDGGVLNVNDVKIDNYCNITLVNGGEINSTGTLTLYGNNADLAPVFNINEGTTANLNNLVHRVGILNGTTIQEGVKTTVYGTLNVAGKFSFEFQDKEKITSADSNLNISGTANINEADITHVGKISLSQGATATIGTLKLGNVGTLSSYGGVVNVNNLVMTGGKLDLGSNAILNITGDSSITGAFTQNIQTCQINITGGTLSYDTATSLKLVNENAKFNVKNGAKILATNQFDISGNGTFTLEKGAKLTAPSLKITSKVNFNGEVVSTKESGSNFYSTEIGSAGTVIFGEGGSLTANANGRIALYGTLVVGSGTDSITTSQIVFWSRSNSLEVNSKNAFVTVDGAHQTLINIPNEAQATIKVSETNEFGTVIFQSDGNNKVRMNLTLDFDGAEDFVSFTDITYNNAVRIYVKNFENNRIKLGKISNIESILELYDLDSEKAINYQWVATDGGYWLNFAAVPEPAEWAMILGSLALGFAVYRRRK